MNLKIVFLFLSILIFTSLFAVAQQQIFSFKNITINNGLSQNSVVDIAEDDLGFMWFATQDGLNRFDGRSFVIFPIAFDDITTPTDVQLGKLAIVDHKIWLITKGGKLKAFDLRTHKINPIAAIGRNKESLPSVSCIHVDAENNLWIGTFHDGLYYLNIKNDVLKKYQRKSEPPFNIISNRIRSIFEDSQNNVWAATEKGLSRIKEGTSKDYLVRLNTNVLAESSNHTLWLGTRGKGIFIKPPGALDFEPFRGFHGQSLPPNLVIETIHADKDSRIWVGTYGNGLFIINTADSTIHHQMPDRLNPFALGFQDVLSIKEDKKGGIWIGTDGGGISYFNRQFNNFNQITIQNVRREISIEQIRSIDTDEEGMVWLGTSGQGLTAFLPLQNTFETFHLEPFKKGLSNYNRIVSLLSDKEGDLWIGTQGNGLLLMDRKSKNIKKWFTNEAASRTENINDNTIWSMLPAKENRVWLATRNAGLLLIDKELGVLKEYAPPAKEEMRFPDYNVQCFIQVNDTILALGFERTGINLFNINTEEFTQIYNEDVEREISTETSIKSLYHHNGWLWVGTSGKGILVTNLHTGNTLVINEKEGLPNNMIYSMLPESDEVIWASTNRGLFRLSYKDSLGHLRIRHIFPFDVADGLQSNEFNTGAFHKSDDGILYFGGISGLNYFHPEDIINKGEELTVVLTGAMIGNSPMSGDTLITYKKKLDLPYWQNSISLDYTVLDFVSSEKLHYQYQMEGYDEDWIEAGNRHYTAYTNLAPGEYTFKVKLSGRTVSEAVPTTLAISIAAPFYLRWWFILLGIAVGAALLYMFYKYRVDQLLQVQKVKNNISADLHDDIGSRLTNIQFLSALSKRKQQENAQTNSYLAKIDEELQASNEALDEIVWNIKMTDESLEDIVAKMRRYASELLESEGLTYTVEIEANFKRKKMSMQKRRELFLVFKELLNNIRKHAEATKVVILISVKNKMFFLSVQDDGKGFDLLAPTDRNGMMIIRERVKRWKGTIDIQSEKNIGTQVTLSIPFRKTHF